MQLDEAAARAGVRLDRREAVGSTNDEALRLARQGERGPLWITARIQAAGRGRRGRTWTSEPGNLYASLLLTDPSPGERAAELSFVAGLALHDAVGALAPSLLASPAPRPRLALKWPNDLLVDGRKAGGILVEGEGAGGGPLAVAIGIGLNCAHHPRTADYPATDLATAGLRLSPDDVFRHLTRTVIDRLAQWDRGAGFARTRAEWLARAAGVGEAIRVILPGRVLTGRFEALDATGRLIVRLADGRAETVTAGEVFPLATGSFRQPGEAT